jgi:hypothetical protein
MLLQWLFHLQTLRKALKILLLCVSIIYTVLKIIEMKSKKDEADK